MATTAIPKTPGLETFLKSLKNSTQTAEPSIDYLIALLKRRQISGSRSCGEATAKLLRLVVAKSKWNDFDHLIDNVQKVGQQLTEAQPREIAVGNIVRRVLGVIRSEAEEDREGAEYGSRPDTPQTQPAAGLATDKGDAGSDDGAPPRPTISPSHTFPLASSASSTNLTNSMFSLLSHPSATPDLSAASTPTGAGARTPTSAAHPTSLTAASPPTTIPFRPAASTVDIRAEVIEAIDEIIDELDQVDDQCASYALEHIHSDELVLVHGASRTVQQFLLRAAAKCSFTVAIAEAFPNEHRRSYASLTPKQSAAAAALADSNAPGVDPDLLHHNHALRPFLKPLAAAGIRTILVPDSAVFALMPRVNKVVLGTHVVLADGGLVAEAGARAVARAAKAHRTPVLVVTGVYKLSPVYPFDFPALIEWGDAGRVVAYDAEARGGDGGSGGKGGDGGRRLEVENPLFDYVPARLLDLYVTNVGSQAPSHLYRVVADHYRKEDTNLAKLD